MKLHSLLSFFAAGVFLAGTASSQFSIDYETDIDGDQAGTTAAVAGDGEFTVDFLNGVLDYDYSVTDLSSPPVAVLIRGPAVPGATGPVILDFGNQASAQGSIPVPQSDLFHLASGRTYMEVQTANNPNGEGRGQITVKPVAYCICDENVAPCENESPIPSGCLNSTGVGATISTSGLASISLDTLVLEAHNLPPNKPALFFGGPNPNDPPLPFGDGHLCLGAPLKRLTPVGQSDGTGFVERGPGIIATLNVNPGEIWCFQAWYRDTQGPCARFFNLSNAIQVTFTD